MSLNRLMLPTRLPHRCEIRTGDQAPTRGGKTRPNRLEHFRITGPKDVCEAVAAVYGGEPREWEGAPTPGAWEVYTQTDVLTVAIPINMPDLLDGPMWELWTGGGRVRRCDGQTCETTRVEKDQAITETTRVEKDQAITETVGCMCNPDDPECKATTRLRVLINGIPGIGTDRLVTHSIHAAMEIPGVIEFLRLTGAQGVVPALLRIRTKTVKRIGQPTKTFPVVTLEPQVDVTDLLAGTTPAQIQAPPQRQAIEAGPVVEESAEDMHDRLMAELVVKYGRENTKAGWKASGSPWLTEANLEEVAGNAYLAGMDSLPKDDGMPRLDPDDPVDGEATDIHPDQESLGV